MSIDPKHIEAVADALDTAQNEHEQNYLNSCARYLLTSTDPAVHAALLAALVRAGVLTEQRVWLRPCGCSHGTFAAMCCRQSAGGPNAHRSRYFTEWMDDE